MNVSHDELPFLQAGLQHYADAKATLDAFESRMLELLDRTIKKRINWSPLKSPKIEPTKTGSHDDGTYFYTMIYGTSPKSEDVEIDCGVWWHRQFQNPIVYAEFYNKPARVAKFIWKGNHGIQSFDPNKKRTVLYIPFPQSFVVDEPLNSLLNALLAML